MKIPRGGGGGVTGGPRFTKGYIARQEMTPEIPHIHVGRLQNGMVYNRYKVIQVLIDCTQFFSGAHFIQYKATINATFGQAC